MSLRQGLRTMRRRLRRPAGSRRYVERAVATSVNRKRTVFYNTLGLAVECPAELVSLIRTHLETFGTGEAGRVFQQRARRPVQRSKRAASVGQRTGLGAHRGRSGRRRRAGRTT
ncbi:MAG: hypothetical protein H0V41_18180 [Pseudonocardiales bacterium]|nr:hypothetical protein [Pseudonocardiales bacterium]